MNPQAPMAPQGPAGPRRAAPRALSALFMLQTTPEPSSSLSPQSRFTHHLSCDLALSHSPSPLTLLSSRVMMNPHAPMAPQGRSQRLERSNRAPDHSRAFE